MSLHDLPERASLEYLKKVAKERLAELRVSDPAATLAQAQLEVARAHGFSSWRALKAEVDRRRAPRLAEFFAACARGDAARVSALLATDRSLVRERTPDGATALHLAVRHPEIVRLLLEHGANPSARELGDNATPLHFAAANKVLESVRLLLDAGADVHGHGDLHDGDVIGWATAKDNQAVLDLLLARGARHHIFSAMALGDRGLVEQIVEEHPEALSRRRSRFESGQTPVHAAFAPPDGQGWLAGAPDYAMLQLLIDLGADVDAPDARGRTPLAVARLRGDVEAMRLLVAAGAKESTLSDATRDGALDVRRKLGAAAASVRKGAPLFSVPDMRATVARYESMGFTIDDRFEHGGELTFARVVFGAAEFALTPGGRIAIGVSMWFFTDQVRELYELMKQRVPDVRFEEDLYQPFYGGRQFGIADLNGFSLVFYQP